MQRYTATCTRPVAKEMCRYEEAEIVSKRIVREQSWIWVETYHETPDMRSIYEFTITSPECIVDRWLSFGVRPQPIL